MKTERIMRDLPTQIPRYRHTVPRVAADAQLGDSTVFQVRPMYLLFRVFEHLAVQPENTRGGQR